MSHLICNTCGSNEHVSGYGLAGGRMGAYSFCANCDTLLELFPDLEGMTETEADEARRYARMRTEGKARPSGKAEEA